MTHRHTEVRIRVTRARVAFAALVITVVATSSIGWAAIGDGGTVQGCVANNGTIDAIDPVTQACKDRQMPVEWYTKAGADAAFLGISGKAADADKLDGRDSSEFAPTLITTDVSRVTLPIDVDTNPVVCFTDPYTPAKNELARIDSWVSVLTTAAMGFQLRNVVSTDGGSTWTELDTNFPITAATAALVWTHGTNMAQTNLTAGTTYQFGVRLARDFGLGDAGNLRCEIFVEASYRS